MNKAKIKSAIRSLGILIVICVIGFFGLKSCVVWIWTYPKETEKYSIVGEDGRSLSIIFLPSKKTIIHYTDPSKLVSEIVLTRMRGTFGTHYIGNLWRVEGPGVLIGLRWCPKGVRPIMMEIKTLEKSRVGPGKPASPPVGKTTRSEMAFAQNALKFKGMWLEKTSVDQLEISELLDLLNWKNDTEQTDAADKQ